MPIIISDLDLEAMETINYTIDQIMALDDDEYMLASEKVLTIVRQYLSGLLLTGISTAGVVVDLEGGRA
jgi:hypothetical protein